MTAEEAEKAIRVGYEHTGGNPVIRAVRYPCPGGVAVVVPVDDWPDLYYVLTDYHVNIFEEIQMAVGAPSIVRLS